ncbi:MAG: 3-hydroxyacyl-ACP dehydratase FabZ [Betaproteobacteria bacterium]|nr:3-hydroxyacyl-ACP dehydratase FabZ [Betaproteobacteria bacterium]
MAPENDAELIMRALPHRHPFLLVDKVLEYEPGKSITARKNVTISEPFFAGHFPGMPVMPGVLILEALAQTCGVLSYLSKESGGYFLLTGLDNCRFRRIVRPGDTLVLRCALERRVRDLFRFAARAEVDGAVACEAKILAARTAG